MKREQAIDRLVASMCATVRAETGGEPSDEALTMARDGLTIFFNALDAAGLEVVERATPAAPIVAGGEEPPR